MAFCVWVGEEAVFPLGVVPTLPNVFEKTLNTGKSGGTYREKRTPLSSKSRLVEQSSFIVVGAIIIRLFSGATLPSRAKVQGLVYKLEPFGRRGIIIVVTGRCKSKGI